MIASKILSARRRVAGCCWTLFALSILTMPGVAWGVCNAFGNIVQSPSQSLGSPSTLGTVVTVNYEFGAGTVEPTEPLKVKDINGLLIDNSIIKVALDCTTSQSSNNRGACLEFANNDGSSVDDGDAILYADNYSYGEVVGGTPVEGLCKGATLTSNGVDGNALPNVIELLADRQLEFATNERCYIEFDVEINSVGNTPEVGSSVQAINASAGFDGECNQFTGADATVSLQYFVELDRDIDILKEVCLSNCGDEANWYDANSETPPDAFPQGVVDTSLFQYRVTVTNTGEEPLTNVVINDNSPPLNLGLVDVPLPGRCLTPADTGSFQPGDSCTIVSGDGGFLNLGDVQACLTEGNKTNVACTDGQGEFTQLPIGEDPLICDPATIKCSNPDFTVDKDGPAKAKVGDTITYSICATNTGSVDLENCVVNDALLGLTDVPFPTGSPGDVLAIGATNVCLTPAATYTIPSGAPDLLDNEAFVTCTPVGSSSGLTRSDTHQVDLFTTAIDVTKSGDVDEAKVGDTVTYTICATNLSSSDAPEFDSCTVTDSLLGLTDAAFPVPAVGGPAVCLNPDPTYTIPSDATGSVDNRADVTCTITAYDNSASDDDSHSVTLFQMSGNMDKICTPDPVEPGEVLTWTITVNNTGDKDFTCLINDATAGLTDESLTVSAGGTNSVQATYTVLETDAGSTISNTASALCKNAGYDNVVDPCEGSPENCTANCEVPQDNDEFCRTPGFWGTHAGTEKGDRSNNLTQAVIDAATGGTLGVADIYICGRPITNTNFDAVDAAPSEFESAVEAICVHPKGAQQRQLMRQLTAAALNCVVFGGANNSDCSNSSIATEFAEANAACLANEGNLSEHIEKIDDFNNGLTTTPSCHEAKFGDYELFDQFDKVPGPAGSSRACNTAIKNDTYVVPVPPPSP